MFVCVRVCLRPHAHVYVCMFDNACFFTSSHKCPQAAENTLKKK